MSAAQASLFDAPVEPVTGSAGDWLGGLLAGELASALCIIAVAMLGFMMLSGRLPVRSGLKVVAGCFLLLGASLAAGGLQGIARETSGEPQELYRGPLVVEAELEVRQPANHDPYAGASLRRR